MNGGRSWNTIVKDGGRVSVDSSGVTMMRTSTRFFMATPRPDTRCTASDAPKFKNHGRFGIAVISER